MYPVIERERPADLGPVVPLTAEENRILTRVADGAPMGRFLQENYWLPAIQSYRVKPGGAPVRVQLLGKKLVAFRADDGRVAVFNEHCPHRRTSLALARNEDNALRCIFHGWKFGVDGSVIEAPSQPYDQPGFCKKVPLKSYTVKESAGLLWVFLGQTPPAFPNFEFTRATGASLAVTHKRCNFNWVQSLDGLHDSAHISIMHQDFLANIPNNPGVAAAAADMAPRYEFMARPAGFRFAAIRQLADSRAYFRVSEFVAPFYNFVAYRQGNVEISVPADDHVTDKYLIQWNLDGPVTVEASTLDDPADWPHFEGLGPEQNWGQNREAMERGAFSGFDIHAADLAVAQSQGSITDREEEFLSDGDAALLHMRRMLIDGARSFADGQVPSIARHEGDAYSNVWCGDIMDVDDADWRLSTG